MQNRKEKFIAFFLSLAFVGTSVFYIAQPTPVFALGVPTEATTGFIGPAPVLLETFVHVPKPTAVTVDFWGAFLEGVIKAAASAGYTIIRKYVRQGLSNLTKDVWKGLLTGGKGQEEMFRTEPWDQFWEQATDEAVGSAIEGFAQGFENEYELQKKGKASAETYKQKSGDNNAQYIATINQQEERLTPTSAEEEAGNLYRASGCQNQPIVSQECSVIHNGTAYQGYYSKTAGTIYSDVNTKKAQAKAKAEAGETQAIQSRDSDILQAKKAANKADADLIAGNVGALSEASKTFVDIVCKPEPDIAFRIFLGLGDQISLAKRKPICPLSVLKENWQEVVANTGAKLDPANLIGWNSLAALLDPGNSDLGASWKLSIGGHSVGSIAQNLATTGFLSEANVGQIKNLTDFSGKTNTPASVIRSVAENTLKVQIEEDTRFIPTGHLLADLILTAGSTVLSTSLNILTEGLRKKQVARGSTRGQGTAGALAAIDSLRNEVLYSKGANPSFGGVEAAEARLAVFNTLDLTPPRDWDVLSKLTSASCPEGMEGGAKGGDIDACVLDDKFAQAVKERITVKEALAPGRGLLSGTGVFGFDISDGSTAKSVSWQRNFPYRSLVILRKYRVLPVSWELAALYMKEQPGAAKKHCGGKNCTLEFMISKFNDKTSPFYGMIDENWVLKIPPVQCALKGYGPTVQSESQTQECAEKNEQGICTRWKTVASVTRQPEQCVDYRTCLDEDEEGKCREGRFGYCLQEQKVIRFKGETCDAQFDGCEVFQDVATKNVQPYIKQSLVQNADLFSGACTLQNAGCSWYSANRWLSLSGVNVALTSDNRAKAFVQGTTQKEWQGADKVYFASSAQKCDVTAEGCRQVNNGPAGTPPYLRIPPVSLRCDTNGVKEDGTEVQWYKRADCKQFAQLCKLEFVGCQQYLPENDAVAVTGKSPDDSAVAIAPNTKPYQYRCPGVCANIYSYAEQKTKFDEMPGNTNHARPSLWFNAATAQKCAVTDVGCEEFTNLEEVKRGGEGKEYYTYLQRCVQEDNPDAIPANQVFYSFVGSDTAGGQPEKYYLVGEGTAGSAGYKPARIVATRTCDKDTFERQQYDPRVGTVVCREFVNASGAVSYEWTDNLIYRTADCTRFRRTIDGDAALEYTYSPQFSRACSSRAAANCREYRAPQAGNIRVISYDNFEESGGNTTWKNWDANTITPANNLSEATLTLSNEGEVLGDHSMKITTTPVSSSPAATQMVYIEKTVSFSKGKNYSIEFNAKRIEGASVGGAHNIAVSFFGFQGGGEASFLGWQELGEKDQWKHFKYTMTLAQSVLEGEGKMLIIFDRPLTGDQVFYLDDIIIKEVEGIEYLVRDSWTRNGSCFRPKNPPSDLTPNFDNPAYEGCSLYTDKQGTTHAIKKFERVCPNEMAGCAQVTVPGGDVVIDSSGVVTGLKDRTVFLIPDAAKACRESDNTCTAYGSPKLLKQTSGAQQVKTVLNGTAQKEEWNITYVKVTPEEARVAPTTFASGGAPSPYEAGICREQDLGCREYSAGSKGKSAYFRDPGTRTCQPPAPGEKDFFYHTCQTTTAIVCHQDSDCPVTNNIQEKCNTNKKERCGFYKEAGGQASEPTPLVRCPCDKDINKLECNNVSALLTDPARCKDIFSNGSLSRDIIKDPISSSFVFACQASAAGCRKISDPECRLNTTGSCIKNGASISCTNDSQCDTGRTCVFDYSLRSDYGRGPIGVPCTPAYYFTENLDTRTKECGGKVDVEQGCLLFNDESKKTFEYRRAGTPVLLTLITDPNKSPCRCDKNPTTEECTNPFPATELDPDVCYERYNQTSGSTPGPVLQKYQKTPTDLKYASGVYYGLGVPTNLGAPAAAYGTPDANTLIKAKQDRQCKLWTACDGLYEELGKEDPVCFKPTLCKAWGGGNSCAQKVGDPQIPGQNGILVGEYGSMTDSSVDNTNAVWHRSAMRSFSGIARPDYVFPNTDTDRNWSNNERTKGGYGFNFSFWRESVAANVPDRTYNALAMKGRLDGRTDNSSIRDNQNITNSCRLYPGQVTPASSTSNVVDACRSREGSWGVYGFCLEPYPTAKENYYGGNNSNYYRMVCTNNFETNCTSDAQCKNADGTGEGRCGLRYYENACLTWLPVDRIRGQQNLFASGFPRQMSMYNGPEDVYYCADIDQVVRAGPTISYTKRPVYGSAVATRSSTLAGSTATEIATNFQSDDIGGRPPYVYTSFAGTTPPQNLAGITLPDSSRRLPDDANSMGGLILWNYTEAGNDVGDNNSGSKAQIQSIQNSNSISHALNVYQSQPNLATTGSIRYFPEAYLLNQVGGGFTDQEIGTAVVQGTNNCVEVLDANSTNPKIGLAPTGCDQMTGGVNQPMVMKVRLISTNNTQYEFITSGSDYDKFKNAFNAGGNSTDCPADVSGNNITYIAVMPKWNGINSSLSGFDYAICRDARMFGQGLYSSIEHDDDGDGIVDRVTDQLYRLTEKSVFAIALSVDAFPITYYSAQTMQFTYNETYCKAYVAAAKGGNAVPNKQLDSFDSAKEGALQLPEKKDNAATDAPIYKVSDFIWSGCNQNVIRQMQDNPVSISMPQGMSPQQFTCNTVPPELDQKAKSENRIDGPRGDRNIKVVEPFDSTKPNFIRKVTPFQKMYEFWEWNWLGPGGLSRPGLQRQAYWDGQAFQSEGGNNGARNILSNYWNATTTQSDVRLPIIYGRTNTEAYKFAFDEMRGSVFDGRTVKFWFYSDYENTNEGRAAKKKQLPLREIIIDFFDGSPLTVLNSAIDGRGIINSPPPSREEAPDAFSGHGPFTYTYAPGRETKVCIRLKDNYGAQSRRCGKFVENAVSTPAGIEKYWTVTFSNS